jgi:hypothetical protein
MEFELLNDFNFLKFSPDDEVYKIGIRKKGKAAVEITDISSLETDKLAINLKEEKKLMEKQRYTLVLKKEEEIYNIPVQVKQKKDEKNYVLERTSDKVICINDSRDYERIELNKTVEYYVGRRVNQLHKGTIKDISALGAKLVTSRDIDTTKPIVIDTAPMNLSLEELEGKVIWKESTEGSKFFNEIQFYFEKEEDQQKLIEELY